jgi:hypothetical protein
MAYRRGYSPQADYYDDENYRRGLEHENDYWHSEAGQYHLRYDADRDDELRRRNAEVMHHMTSIYFSKKVIWILVITVVLSLLTAPLNNFVIMMMGLNFMIFFMLFLYSYVTAKTRVRPEIRSRHDAILMSAQHKAFRR